MAQLICEDCGDVIESDVDIPDDHQASGGGGGDIQVDDDVLDELDIDPGHGHPDGSASDGAADGGIDIDDDILDDVTPDDIDDAVGKSDDRDVKDTFGVDPDADITDTPDDIQRRYDVLQDRLEDDMQDRQDDRDDRVSQGTFTPHERIRAAMRDQGIDRDIEDAFRQFTNRNVSRPSRHGSRIHVRNALRRESGDWTVRDLYQREEPIEVGDRAVSVAVDASWSMGKGQNDDDRIFRCKLALAALARACDVIGDSFMASAFTTENPRSPIGDTLTPLITGPDERFKWGHLDAFEPTGCTPIADGAQDAYRMLDDHPAREKVLIIITDADGMGLRGFNQNLKPRRDTKEVVEAARDDGMTVLGFGVDDAHEGMMQDIFGDDGYIMTDSDSLVDDLVEVYRQQMAAV